MKIDWREIFLYSYFIGVPFLLFMAVGVLFWSTK